MNKYFVSLLFIVFLSQETISYNNYIGCYRTLSIQTSNGFFVSSIASCLTYCKILNLSFGSIKNRTECYCSSRITNSSISSSNCNLTCQDRNGVCGGVNEYSVYLDNVFQTKYLGCFIDDQNARDMLFQNLDLVHIWTMTNEKCSKQCFDQKFQFMGTQDGGACFCGNTYGIHGAAQENECKKPCSGIRSQICGGTNRNSVYSTCYIAALNKSCNEIFHCSNEIGTNGICTNTACDLGWKGSFCDQRDCNEGYESRTIFDNCTDINECEYNNICNSTTSTCINTIGSYLCECKRGFESVSLILCKDINECDNNMCNSTTFTCNNTIGSYLCLCKQGFKSVSSIQCEDINECDNNMCDSTTSTCNNTIGSYLCECKQGFKSVSSILCRDINECEDNNMCNLTTSTCINTNGSYLCECKRGFESVSSLLCRDIDECISNPCNQPSQKKCMNTFGSYFCSCSDGYQYVNSSYCEENILQDNQEKKSSETGKIIGAVIGAVLGVILIVFIIFLIHHIRNRSKPGKEPFYDRTKLHLSKVENYFAVNRKEIFYQFKSCPEKFEHDCIIGSCDAVAKKNRFKTIYPYDYNRIKLKKNYDENHVENYINASLITTCGNGQKRVFIATQGPNEETVEDFWRMVDEQDVEIIVMLTKCCEEGKIKCHLYWPEKRSEKHGDLSVAFISMEKRLNYEHRTFQVISNTSSRTIHHFLYSTWPDKSVPANVVSLLNLHHKIMSLQDQNAPRTIIVHCSAGVGRTGTFIALDYLLRQAEEEKGYVDVCQCLNHLRNQRRLMIQKIEQYELCYRAMAMLHKIGRSTYFGTKELSSLDSLLSKVTSLCGDADLMHKQFQLIENEVGTDKVKADNKVHVVLSSGELDAVYVPNCRDMSACIVGKMPERLTVVDFTKLFVENCRTVVFMDKSENFDLSFLPSVGQISQLKGCLVELCNENKTDFGTLYNLRIERNSAVYENESKTTYVNADEIGQTIYANTVANSTFVHVKKSPGGHVDHQFVKHLRSIIEPSTELKQKNVVSVLSSTGYEDAGYLVAALNLIGMMENFNEVDVYETVFELRNIQPKIIKTIDLYRELYLFVGDHLADRLSPPNLLISTRQTMNVPKDCVYANQSFNGDL